MKRFCLLSMILLCAGAVPLSAAPVSYMGSLSVGGGGDGLLTAFGPVWDNPTTTLSWTVDNTTTPGLWHYEYTLQTPGPGAAISHMIVEVSDEDPGPAFTPNNLQSPASNPANWIQTIEFGLQFMGPGNPYMPDDIYGVKFNAGTEALTATISFDSDRAPVWGDFYAKCGGAGGIFNAVYNAGFADPDPLTAPHDGTELNHLLVPDSTTTQVPAPGAIALAALGIGLVGRFGRRRIS